MVCTASYFLILTIIKFQHHIIYTYIRMTYYKLFSAFLHMQDVNIIY
jgi:hypothetical protein